MATTSKTPGVYITEQAQLPTSVQQVETAVPAFIGYTQHSAANGASYLLQPVRIHSLQEYEAIFGGAGTAIARPVMAVARGRNIFRKEVNVLPSPFRMYHSLQLYFANGGNSCFIVSVGSYADASASVDHYPTMKEGLDAAGKEAEPTLLLFPDACMLPEPEYYTLYKEALGQCGRLMNRMVIIDLYPAAGETQFDENMIARFREGIGEENLKYGAAYYPYLRTTIPHYTDEAGQPVGGGTIAKDWVLRAARGADDATRLKSVYHTNRRLYYAIRKAMAQQTLVLPAGSAVAGVYCQNDAAMGVWKAPANISLNCVIEPVVAIGNSEQDLLSQDPSGKSVNAIRMVTGKGTLIWGARTLAGNDNEWRYIPVRRFFIMVETSVKKALESFVFEPNDANTWVKVQAMIENFLSLQWRTGALMGVKPDEAFFVRVGLGHTMTATDLLEGRLIIELGMAMVRPAEFTIIRIVQNMMTR